MSDVPDPLADASRRDDAPPQRRRMTEAAHDGAPALDADALAEHRWVSAMRAGDFARAWRVSDAVLAARSGQDCSDRPPHLRWLWDGTRLNGRGVLVRCWHGLGDTIQFIRFAPMLRRLARGVTVAAQPALMPLLASAAGIDALLPLHAARPARCDAEIESMEVPYALRTMLATLPAAVPYLAVPPARIAAARRIVSGYEHCLKVGLAWAAGDWDGRRTVPLRLLAGLNRVPGIALFNLQRGPALASLGGRAAPTFVHRGKSLQVLETAALMSHLDLIVTVDTMVAHLAGALARPVWTLLHFGADWRWLLDREDSPWYPTMRLFRQPAPGEWVPVIDRLTGELARIGAAADCRVGMGDGVSSRREVRHAAP